MKKHVGVFDEAVLCQFLDLSGVLHTTRFLGKPSEQVRVLSGDRASVILPFNLTVRFF